MANTNRRTFLAMIAGGLVMASTEETTAWGFDFPSIEGGRLDFASLKGRALLVVNTASFCGYTYQYDALEKLHKAREADGLTVIGVPSQDFDQESAENATVKIFCETRFGIDFPLAAISHVKGPQAVPFYAWIKQQRGWEPSWNFNKVLIGRDGRVVATFGSGDEPDGPAITKGIAGAL